MMSRKRRVSLGLLLVCGSLVWTAAGCQATSGFAFNNSGKAYYQRGNYAMARDEFRRAAIDDPTNPDYRNNLAMALKKTGDVQGAEQVLRQSLTQVSAMHQPSYHTLSQILIEQNRHAEAQQLVQTWAETQPYVPESQIELAWIQRETGDMPGAEQSLRRALRVNPSHPIALAQLGQLYQDSGQSDRAATLYQRSLASRWQQPQVQSRLQTLVDGSARNSTRSAMMMNSMSGSPTSFAYGQPTPMSSITPASAPMMTSQPMMTSNPVMAGAPVLGPQPTPSISSGGTPTPVTFESPVVSGPVLMPNADPAHAQQELTAELPLVESY